VTIENGLDESALHAAATPVDEPDLRDARSGRCFDVFRDDRRNISRQEGVQIDLGFDGDVNRIGHRSAARRLRVGGGHSCLDAAANGKISDDRHAARLERRDEIVENLVGRVFVEDPAVSEADEVVLQRLELYATVVRNVGDPDLAEVRQARLRAERLELRAANLDFVVAFGSRVGKRLER
jgi:hypothetical protein